MIKYFGKILRKMFIRIVQKCPEKTQILLDYMED